VAAIEGGLLVLDEGTDPQAAENGGMLDAASKAGLLRLFAQARQSAIRRAYRAGDQWPPEWLSDVNAAYTILAEGPLGGPEPLVECHDFLCWIGATPRANTVLDDALRRFPDSPVLHERLRARLLWEGGPEGLEREYAERLAQEGADPDRAPTQLTWFAGYASLVAAEHHRRRGEHEVAVAAYGRGIAHYRRNVELFPDGEDTCLHFIALAHAGLARVALERGELDEATREMLAGLQVRPDSAATQDGLGITPVMTAKMLAARLQEVGDEERAAQVQAALDALDPKLLEPPPTELPGARQRGRRGPPRGRDGSAGSRSGR
jgi:hypothetical protein